jgi:hypothetical protein
MEPPQTRNAAYRGSSNALNQHGDALADADAHRRHCPPTAGAFQGAHCCAGEPCAGHPERVPKGDGAAVRIDVLGVIGKAKAARNRKSL